MDTVEKINDKMGKIIRTRIEEQIVTIEDLRRSIRARQAIISKETEIITILEKQIQDLKDLGVKENDEEVTEVSIDNL